MKRVKEDMSRWDKGLWGVQCIAERRETEDKKEVTVIIVMCGDQKFDALLNWTTSLPLQ